MSIVKIMKKNKKQLKCYICKKLCSNNDVTYKEDDKTKKQPICYSCLRKLFYGGHQLKD